MSLFPRLFLFTDLIAEDGVRLFRSIATRGDNLYRAARRALRNSIVNFVSCTFCCMVLFARAVHIFHSHRFTCLSVSLWLFISANAYLQHTASELRGCQSHAVCCAWPSLYRFSSCRATRECAACKNGPPRTAHARFLKAFCHYAKFSHHFRRNSVRARHHRVSVFRTPLSDTQRE